MTADARIEFVHQGKPHVLTYRDSDHSYRIDGTRVPSISTVANVGYQNVDGLLGWANKLGREGKSHNEQRDLAAEWGTAAHNQLEVLATTGSPLSLTDQPEHVRGCLSAIADWWLTVRPVFKASEVIVCHPEFRYAGRFDGLVEVDGKLALFDLKTSGPELDWDEWSKSRAAKAYSQLAGYALAYRVLYSDRPQPINRYILRVGADGVWDFQRDLVPMVSELSFLAKLHCYSAERDYRQAVAAERKALAA